MIRVNLIKADKAEAGKRLSVQEPEVTAVQKKKGPSPNLAIALAIIVLAGLAFLQKRALDTEQARLAAAREDQKKLQPVVQKLALLEQQKALLEQKVLLINGLRDRQPLAVKILEEMSLGLPEFVWLTDVNLTNRTLAIKGRAISNTLVSDYMDHLNKSGLFLEVNLGSSLQKVAGNNTYLEFTLNATVPPPPNETPPAVPGKAPAPEAP
jgi:type IV pilus assembly protein PilN